jgi:hypothetical protein
VKDYLEKLKLEDLCGDPKKATNVLAVYEYGDRLCCAAILNGQVEAVKIATEMARRLRRFPDVRYAVKIPNGPEDTEEQSRDPYLGVMLSPKDKVQVVACLVSVFKRVGLKAPLVTDCTNVRHVRFSQK